MPLILRSVLGTKLSIAQMDGNLTYLVGTLSGSVIQVTGSSFSAPSTAITASVVSASFTGSLFGTASWANNVISASFASTASFFSGSVSNATSASYASQALSSSFTSTASYVLNAVSASFATNALTASFLPVGTYNITSSWAISASQAVSSSFATTASFAATASYFSGSISNAISASYALTASIADKIKVVNVGGAYGITYPLLGNIFAGNATVYTIESPDYKYDVTNNRLIVSSITASFTGSLLGTSSWAQSASQAISASWAPGSVLPFPYTGSALITGSLGVTGSFNQGSASLALGLFSHAQGLNTLASASYSHAEGSGTIASASFSHAEGSGSIAYGIFSKAVGFNTYAVGPFSYAGGNNTIIRGFAQTVVGDWNVGADTSSPFTVGGGISGSRKDAFIVTDSSSIIVATQSAAPTWTGREGEMVPAQSGSIYFIYTYIGGAWRSASLA